MWTQPCPKGHAASFSRRPDQTLPSKILPLVPHLTFNQGESFAAGTAIARSIWHECDLSGRRKLSAKKSLTGHGGCGIRNTFPADLALAGNFDCRF